MTMPNTVLTYRAPCTLSIWQKLFFFYKSFHGKQLLSNSSFSEGSSEVRTANCSFDSAYICGYKTEEKAGRKWIRRGIHFAKEDPQIASILKNSQLPIINYYFGNLTMCSDNKYFGLWKKFWSIMMSLFCWWSCDIRKKTMHSQHYLKLDYIYFIPQNLI